MHTKLKILEGTMGKISKRISRLLYFFFIFINKFIKTILGGVLLLLKPLCIFEPNKGAAENENSWIYFRKNLNLLQHFFSSNVWQFQPMSLFQYSRCHIVPIRLSIQFEYICNNNFTIQFAKEERTFKTNYKPFNLI